MTGASIHSPDRTSVPPKADVRVATAVTPTAVATLNSVVAASLRRALALAGVSSPDLAAVSSGIAALSARSIKKAITFAVAAASEIISPSVSTTSIPTT